MTKIWDISKNVLYTLALWSWGVIFIVHNTLNGEKLDFKFRNVSQEKLTIQMIAASIAFVLFGLAAYFIAKRYKAKKPYLVVLVTFAIITGTQALAWYTGLYKVF